MACDNCMNLWEHEVPLRYRVDYSFLQRCMIAQDQANEANAEIIMCPNCNCLEDVRKNTNYEAFTDIDKK